MRHRSKAIAVVRERRRDPSPLIWLALAMAWASGTVARGETPSPSGPSEPPKLSAPSPDSGAPPTGTGQMETGVVRPPPMVDPGITKPTPNPQAYPTPVIPPPGTPGNPSPVVPK